MAPAFLSRPKSAALTPLSPYFDDRDAHNLICPRYADSDASAAPASPVSIESFDILDSVAWRRGYIWSNTGRGEARRCTDVWKKKKSPVVAVLLFILLLLVGCSFGIYGALKYEMGKIKADCTSRGGGDRCEVDTRWAKCVAKNGAGYCQGVL